MDAPSRPRLGRTALLSTVAMAMSGFGPRLHAHVDFAAPRVAAAPDRLSTDDVRAADLDQDGRPELVAAPPGGLVVYRFDDLVGFVESQFHPTTGGSGGVFVRDLDDDGDADVLVVREDDLHVFGNDGAGNLFPAFAPPTGGLNWDAALGDFDGDGSVDAVVAQSAHSRVATLLGDGGLGFGPPLYSPAGARFLAGGDFDEDGIRDVVVMKTTLDVLLGDGTGAFVTTMPIASSAAFTSMVSRDFNGDFHADVVASSDVDGWFVCLGRGDGTFDVEVKPELTFLSSLMAEDWDGDGDMDLAASGGANWLLFLNDGTGAFSIEPAARVGCVPSRFAAADFTGDGVLDWAGVERAATWLIEGAPGPSFPSPRNATPEAAQGFSSVVLADVDRDGHVDIIREKRATGEGRIEWARADGAGAFESAVLVSSFATSYSGFAVGDFDGDGSVDVAALWRPDFIVRLGDGAGAFLPPVTTPTLPEALGPILAVDLDSDGLSDIVAALARDEESLAIHLATGGGGLASPVFVDSGEFPTALASGDFDADGFSDVLVGKRSGSSAFVLAGDGAGSLSVAAGLDIALPVSSVRALDAGDDGFLDAILISDLGSPDPSAWVVRGRGDMTFDPPERVQLVATGSPSDFAAADFDGDGRTELLVSVRRDGVGESEGIAIVSRGDGGAFSETASIARCGGGGVAVLDFDENGVPDLLVDASFLVENRSLDPVRVRRGAVNAGAGRIADVLLCNGSPGLGEEREFRVAPSTPFEIAMLGTPFDADGPVRFSLYAWLGHVPTSATVRVLPFGLGVACLPMPLVPGAVPQPRVVWNNLGRQPLLGSPDFVSSPAPSIVASKAGGIGREITLTLQGIVLDPHGRNGLASVTNAVIVICE